MKSLPFLFMFFVLFSCSESDKEQFESGMSESSGTSGTSGSSGSSGTSGQQDIVTDVYGTQYPSLDPSVIYCGPGFGTKMCHFLHKHDGTIWADAENYYSEFSDIKFTNLYDPYFISFFNLDSIASYCEGWDLGETTYNGIKWNIEIKKDQEDVFWFDYEYYGSNEEIEYTITYKYEVIKGLLHFSNTNGQTFIFHPSQRNYSEDFVETDEIIKLNGCLFY